MLEAGESITVRTSRDIVAPIISNLKIDSTMVQGRTDRVQTIVSWRTDEPAVSIVEYEEGSAKAGGILTNKAENTETFTTAHTIIIARLKPGTLYQVRVSSIDDAGNKIISPIRTIITPRQAESIVDVVVKNFEDTFKFLQNIR